MSESITVQGRCLSSDDVSFIRGLLVAHPEWHRTRLSRELCQEWAWVDEVGRPKDMACRTLLLKLERRGLIQLPPRASPGAPNHRRFRKLPEVAYDQEPIEASLKELRPLEVSVVKTQAERRLFTVLLAHHHYLGFRGTVGENMRYLVRDRQKRVVACFLFGSAAWKAADRDQFIGWPPKTRSAHLQRITNNTRFLILPWVRVPHLASHILGLITRRIAEDWQRTYGHPVHLLETFVERERFRGTCYRAANWIRVGETRGRTRNDRDRSIQAPVKDIYVFPLVRNFRHQLMD